MPRLRWDIELALPEPMPEITLADTDVNPDWTPLETDQYYAVAWVHIGEDIRLCFNAWDFDNLIGGLIDARDEFMSRYPDFPLPDTRPD